MVVNYYFELADGKKILGHIMDKEKAKATNEQVGEFIKGNDNFMIIKADKASELYPNKAVAINTGFIKAIYIQ